MPAIRGCGIYLERAPQPDGIGGHAVPVTKSAIRLAWLV
jgi:hypothetical protein